jgi:hypothetical protein
MSTPSRLYDGSDSTGTEIALVRLTTQRRRVFPAVPAGKGRDGWTIVLPNPDSGLSMRIVAEGHFGPTWIATLYDRQSIGSANNYFVAMAHGDSHGGLFVVEAFDELAPAQNYRLFSLVLLSAGTVTYTPA